MSRPMRVGELFRLSVEPDEIYAVKLREKFNFETDTTRHFTAAVAATGNSGWIDILEMEPRKTPPELMQVNIGFEDGFDYYLKYPSGTNIHGVNRDKDVAYVNSERSPVLSMNEDYEAWSVYGWFPSINARNNTAYNDTPQAYFEGYKYLFRAANAMEKAAVAAMKRSVRFIQLGGVQQQEGS